MAGPLAGLDKLPAQLGAFWRGLAGGQRFAFLSILLITLGVLTLLFRVVSEPQYTTLYANLSPEDASTIVDELSTAQVRFKLTHAGTSIQVPVERVYDLRLELAAKGLPSSGPVGFELFDENGLGMTPFQQRVHFRRALEGELARTISQLAPVRSARVHITIPKKTVFQRDRVQPRAAVVVTLAPGRSLSEAETNGIAQLLSGSVEGLQANQITILDASGRLLAQPGSEQADMLAAETFALQRRIERDLSQRAMTLLDASLGRGNAVVTVSARINTRHFEETAERVRPEETAVVSEQRSEETRSEPSFSSGGVPGVAANIPGGAPAGQTAGALGTETITRETINFDFSRSSSRTVVPIGEIQQLSVAVLVDGTYSSPETAEGEEPAEPVYQPRSEQEIQQISEIVKHAIGFDSERGDVIAVQTIAFRSPLADFQIEEVPFWKSPELFMLLPAVGRVFALLAGLTLISVLVLRPALRQLSALPGSIPGTPMMPSMPGMPIPQLTPEQQTLEVKAAELAIPINKDQAKNVADALKSWLRE